MSLYVYLTCAYFTYVQSLARTHHTYIILVPVLVRIKLSFISAAVMRLISGGAALLAKIPHYSGGSEKGEQIVTNFGD